MRSWRAASRPRRAASLLARCLTLRWSGLTMSRRRLTSTLGSPGAGSTTAVRSSTAVTQTRRPSTSASKSGRISSSSSIETMSRRTSSVALLDGLSMVFRFEAMFICQIPDHEQDQTQHDPGNEMGWKKLKKVSNSRSEPPPQLEEDGRPDRGRYKNAQYENPVRDAKYSGQSRKDDPHARNVTAEDDRPG